MQDSPNEETLEQKQGNHEGLSCDIFTVLSKPYVPSKLVVETSIYIRCLQFSVPLRSAVSGQPVFRHDRPIYISTCRGCSMNLLEFFTLEFPAGSNPSKIRTAKTFLHRKKALVGLQWSTADHSHHSINAL